MADFVDEQLSEVNEVCNFLEEKRGLSEEIIQLFRDDKMDAMAIQGASDDVLINEYQITARGDLYALRAFCEEKRDKKNKSNNDQRKKELIAILAKGREQKKTTGKKRSQNRSTSTSNTDITEKTRKISLGWLNYDEKTKKFKHVREIQGGGTRPISVPGSFTKDDVLQKAIKVYLSEDDKLNMDVELGNFKTEPIQDDDLGVPFTVENYYKIYQLSRARFYLITKPKVHTVSDEEQSDNDSSADESLMKSPFDATYLGSSSQSSGLLGTSEERAALREEQQREYEECLQADRLKRQKMEESRDLERLREARKSRIPSEPGVGEVHFTIAVRHPSLGTLRRRFPIDAQMSSVYDWLGSLQTEPPYFMLKFIYMSNAIWIRPTSPVSVAANNVLVMEVCQTPLPLSEDDPEVSFLGYGSEQEGLSANDDTLSHNVFDPYDIPQDEELPQQILDNEEIAGEESEKPITLEQRQLKILQSMEENAPCRVVQLQRNNIVSELMALYSDENFAGTRVLFGLKNEMGSDYGEISRDVFASFWREEVLQFCEGHNNLFVPRYSGLSRESYTNIGKVIHHGFIMTGIFTVVISQSYMQAMIVGEDTVTDEFVLTDFLNYLSTYESNRLKDILASSELENDDKAFILELEDRYGMRTMPNEGNVKRITIQMARSELIELPMHTMRKVKEGMMTNSDGKLWKNVSVQDLAQVYEAQSPTAAKVVSLLTAGDDRKLTSEETKMYDLLCRYVRSSDQSRCVDFLKYCTGSIVIVVQEILVTFYSSSAKEPLPIAHTCGAVLEMPSSGYTTFNKFRTTMDALLSNPASYQFGFE